MAEGGNNQSSNGSRFTKSYSVSNSFVTKVASRVSDYLGGWFGTPLKTSQDAESRETTLAKASGDTTEKRLFENVDTRRSTFLTHRMFDDVDTLSSPAKRFKISDNERVDVDFPISPIPSTSGLFQSTVNHTFDAPKSDHFGASGPRPPTLRGDKFRRSNDGVPQTSSTATEVKANGATDNHSDSSESTSGCSSLVPQSDRLSQSAYVGSARKRNLEEKLKYARQLQQSRASLYLNRSIPVNDALAGRKKPSFDVTVYGSPLDKAYYREKLINSPFYTGQTSYGGASAHRVSRSGFFSQRNARTSSERREGVQVQVKPSQQGSSEDLANMSHTAKKILEALEQFSTPVNDAKRIPVSRANVPLGTKRRRFDDLSETRLTLSTPMSPLNPNPGPVIAGLNVPTVPDLLKLKRLERIQNSTAAARQVAIREQEYRLPDEKLPAKRTGKIVTKLKHKEKDVPLEKLEEVNLPKIPLPITTLPRFDFELPAVAKPAADKTEKPEKLASKKFVFSPPIAISVQELPEGHAQKKNFTFSKPLNANGEVSEPERKTGTPLVNFMSSDVVAKLKRKSVGEGGKKSAVSQVPPEQKTDGLVDLSRFKKQPNQWECSVCLIRNKESETKCAACETPRPGATSEKAEPKFTFGAGVAGEGFKFGIEKAGAEVTGVKSAADSSTFMSNANGLQAEPSKRPSQFSAISTSVGVFTFGIPSAPTEKEDSKAAAPKPVTETSGSFLVTSTSGSTSQKEDPHPENKSDSLRPAEPKDLKGSDSSKLDLTEPITFAAPNNSPPKPPPQEKPKDSPQSKTLPPTFFPASSNFTPLETVSSSTTDFTFPHKPVLGPSKPPDAISSDSPAPLPPTSFAPSPTTTLGDSLNPPPEENKTDSAVSTSATVTTAPHSFTPSPVFNLSSKITFGTASTTSPELTFGTTTSSTANASLFAQSAPAFTAPGFKSHPSATSSSTSFGIAPHSPEKSTLATLLDAYKTPSAFSTTPANSFTLAPTPSQNPDPPKPFSSFGANASILNFGSNPTPVPSFGGGFMQPANTADKLPAPAPAPTPTPAPAPAPTPFIFGATTTPSTAAPALPVTAPGVFTFGATKPDSKALSAFTFGQSTAPSFSFGSSAPATNFFGGFGQSKPENSLGAPAPVFGSTTPSIFGQSSAPPAFESPAPKFDFGDSLTQSQHQENKSLFQFGAPPPQPASAPAGSGFSLSVPQKFNFTGGHTPAFSAPPDAESPSVMRRNRKVIKAVRRTNRDPARRPQ